MRKSNLNEPNTNEEYRPKKKKTTIKYVSRSKYVIKVNNIAQTSVLFWFRFVFFFFCNLPQHLLDPKPQHLIQGPAKSERILHILLPNYKSPQNFLFHKEKKNKYNSMLLRVSKLKTKFLFALVHSTCWSIIYEQ